MQKRHPYSGNLKLEMSGDSKNVFLHCGDGTAHSQGQESVDELCCLDPGQPV